MFGCRSSLSSEISRTALLGTPLRTGRKPWKVTFFLVKHQGDLEPQLPTYFFFAVQTNALQRHNIARLPVLS